MNAQKLCEVIPVIEGPLAGRDYEVVDSRTGDMVALKSCRSDAEALAAELNAAFHTMSPSIEQLWNTARKLRITGMVI